MSYMSSIADLRLRPSTLVVVALFALAAGCADLTDDAQDESAEAQTDELRRRKRPRFPACTAKTCSALGVSCGPAADGCGGTLDCGICAAPPQSPPPSNDGWSVGKRPFKASSSWNTPIPAGATYKTLDWPASTGWNYWVNWDAYSPAIHEAKASDPVVQVAVPAGWGYSAQTVPIHIPRGVTGAAGTDGEILMVDGTTIHNCWQFKRTSDTAGTCAAYARADAVTGTGWGTKSPFLGAGIVAAGSSQYAGLIVQAETDAGEIEHALQIALDGALQKPGPVGEAISSDGWSSSGIAQEGERFALPPGTPMPNGLSPLGQKVFRAMMKYGVFNIDVAGGTTILRAQSNAYDESTIDALRRDVNKFMPQLRRVQF